MVNEVTFVVFMGMIAPPDPPLSQSQFYFTTPQATYTLDFEQAIFHSLFSIIFTFFWLSSLLSRHV